MRRTKVFLAGAVAAALLTGCSNGGATNGGDTGGQASGGGAGSAQSAGQAKDLATLARNISVATQQKKTVKFTMEMAAGKHGSVSGTGELNLSKDQPASHTKMSTKGGQGGMGASETITIGKITYLKSPGPAAYGNKPWAKLDLKDQSNPLARLMNAMGSQAQQSSDPAQTIAQMRAGGSLTGTAPEQVDGKQTTKYTIKIDMQKAANAAKDKQTKSLMQLAVKAGVTNYPVMLWVDQDNLPVQMKMETPVPNMPGGQQRSKEPLTVTVKYQDWGKPVDIKAPPASQVGELKLPDLGKLGRGGAPAPTPGG